MPEPAPNPHYQVYLHAVWPVAGGGTLPDGVAEKLIGYITRYAQTLKTTVYAVGAGASGRALHLIFNLPPHLNLDELMRDLQKPSERWVSGSLGAAGFRWNAAILESVSPSERDGWIKTVTSGQAPDDFATEEEGGEDDERLPAWLNDALKKPRDGQ